MRILGIDLGSREVKIAIMEDQNIIDRFKISTMTFYRDYCNYNSVKGISVDFDKLNVGKIDKCISTGYGRNNISLSKFTPINELKAHVYGVFYQTNLRDFCLLDIGGQDVKVVKVEKGIITDLDLNEKCAASCGRFLENMASVLEISIDDMYRYYEDPVELNSTCAVFSESELIGKIAEGASIESLCAGVNYSMFKRLQPMLQKFKGKRIVLSGGVARNDAIRKYIKDEYDEIVVPDEPQFSGAIGCCYYGSKMKE